jgi:hypothetical protein
LRGLDGCLISLRSVFGLPKRGPGPRAPHLWSGLRPRGPGAWCAVMCIRANAGAAVTPRLSETFVRRKAFWENDFAGCGRGPLGASQGVPSGSAELWEPPGAFGPSRHRARVVAEKPLDCSLGYRGTPLAGFWAPVLKPLGGPFWGLLVFFWCLSGASLGPLGGLLGRGPPDKLKRERTHSTSQRRGSRDPPGSLKRERTHATSQRRGSRDPPD